MKKVYESPELEISWFELVDVIATSVFHDPIEDNTVSDDDEGDITMDEAFG